MIDTLLSLVAPHLCSGCGFEGVILCDNCKYDIVSEPFGRCLACGMPTDEIRGICRSCRVSYKRAWCVGERSESLYALIEQYKFYRAKAAYQHLARLLDATLPELPTNTVIVPIPTLRAHVRERGYDHMELIAREFARQRRLAFSRSIKRATKTKQLGANRAERIRQAKQAFYCDAAVEGDRPYLIVDDVVTTGATVEYAARALLSVGVKEVWVASISRQSIKF